MNVFAEVKIRSNRGTAYLIDALREFCTDQNDWVFDEERSAIYSADLPDCAGCVIVFKGNTQKLGIALCEERKGLCRIANIVPKRTSSIETDEYNQIAQQFYDAVKQWSRQNRAGLQLAISKTDIELEDIIIAKIPLKLFKIFLRNYPLSYHPKDIGRLDQFICAVSIFSRKRIEWEYLGQYLKEKERWPQENVDWCLDRIRIGLDVIREYKKFH